MLPPTGRCSTSVNAAGLVGAGWRLNSRAILLSFRMLGILVQPYHEGNDLREIAGALLAAALTAAGLVASALPAEARSGLKIGMTVQQSEYSAMFAKYEDQGVNVDSTRVFFTGLPSWDSRITTLNARGIVPFVSWKTHDVGYVRDWLLAMPSNIPLVYLAEFHEAEADMSAATYKARQIETWNMIVALPSNIRSRTRFGPIQTKQWTENGGHSYAEYDPGVGDFWGVDAYVNSWGAQDANSYPDHIQWLSQIQLYDTCRNGYCRKKWIPELGAVSRCQDTQDFGRATWLNRVAQRLEDDTSVQLVLWWDTTGTAGANESCLGTARNFRLDSKTTYANGVYSTSTPNPPETKRVWTEFMQRNTP